MGALLTSVTRYLAVNTGTDHNQGDVSTNNLQDWMQDNVVPLLLLAIAIIILWLGGRGDNAGVARRGVGLLVGLTALGIAVSGRGPDVGNFLADLITG